MQASSPIRVRAPYGLAFPVHELVFIRAWAEGRGLTMNILLGQVLDGAEFEEMVMVRSLASSRPALTLWRVASGSMLAQAEGSAPRVFGDTHAALSHAAVLFAPSPARAPSLWRRLRGLKGG